MNETGLRFLPPDWRAASIAVGLCVAGVVAAVLVVDDLFREHLNSAYITYFTSPLMPRMFVISGMAAIEEVIWRLIVTTAFAWLAMKVCGRTLPAWGWIVVIMLVQLWHVWSYVHTDALYASVRYLGVGSVWGWLYWRHGWVSALIGHSTTHLVLDPALYLTLQI